MVKRLFCVLALMLAMSLGISAAVPYDFGGGVVYYGFDDQAATDGGEGKLNGRFVGDGIEIVDGLGGGCAVKMNSDSYVEIPVAATCPSETMSVIVWFRTDRLNGAWNRIISTGVWGEQAAPGILVGVFHTDDADYVAFGIGADDAKKNKWDLIGAPEGAAPYGLDDGKWHCIGYTVGEGSGALYLDGEQIHVFEYSAEDCSTVTYEESACIGGFLYYGNMNEPFSGTVDEVYFIPSVVGADAMKAYYDAETQGKITHVKTDPPAATDGSDSPAVSTEPDSGETSEKPAASSAQITTDAPDSGKNTGSETKPAPGDRNGAPVWVYIAVTAVIVIAAAAAVVIAKKKTNKK